MDKTPNPSPSRWVDGVVSNMAQLKAMMKKLSRKKNAHSQYSSKWQKGLKPSSPPVAHLNRRNFWLSHSCQKGDGCSGVISDYLLKLLMLKQKLHTAEHAHVDRVLSIAGAGSLLALFILCWTILLAQWVLTAVLGSFGYNIICCTTPDLTACTYKQLALAVYLKFLLTVCHWWLFRQTLPKHWIASQTRF